MPSKRRGLGQERGQELMGSRNGLTGDALIGNAPIGNAPIGGKWSGRQDLNLRRLGPKPSALPG